MTCFLKKLVSGAAFSVLVLSCVGVARASVMNIEIINTDGRIEADSFFLPSSDPGAHFSLATLGIDETAGAQSGDELWWDVEVKVTVSTDMIGQDAMIAIDKDVLNNTPYLWTDFHMTLGQGLGANFQESDEFDGLFFKENPEPIEKTGFFSNPPERDEPGAPDNLWWFFDPGNPDPNQASFGVAPGETPFFWLGINVPAGLFGGPAVGGDPTMAVFTLRQHASIPEPSAALLFTSAGSLLVLRRRK